MGALVLIPVPLPLAVPSPQRMRVPSRWSILTPSQVHLQGPSAEDSSAPREAYWTYAELTSDCYPVGHIWSPVPATSTVSQRQDDPKAAESITKAIRRPLSLPQDFLSRNQTPDPSSRSSGTSQASVRYVSRLQRTHFKTAQRPLPSLNLVKNVQSPVTFSQR